MTDPSVTEALPPDMVDTGVSDVLNEDEVVHVPHAVEQMVEAQEAEIGYAPEVPHWEPGS
jgi:hypothetical protein